jgi:hypothetical protein
MAASRRSRVSVTALWAAVGLVAAVAILVVVGSAFLGGGDDDRRDAAARYIVQANRVQQGLGSALVQVNRIYGRLRLDADPPSGQLAELERAERTLSLLAQQVEAVQPPAEAEGLHSELERLAAMQVAFAHEVSELGRYAPRLAAAERPLAAAAARLRRELAAEPTPETQGRAFRRYGVALRAVAADVEALSAPPVLEPARLAEAARLRRLVALAENLRSALTERRAEAVAHLTQELSNASAEAGASSAERAAVAAYRRRLSALAKQRAAVERARDRLDRELS